MPTKESDSNRRLNRKTQIKKEISDRIGWGPRTGETVRDWMNAVEKLGEDATKNIGKKEVGQAWMVGIATLSFIESSANRDLTDARISLIERVASKDPVKASEYHAREASKTLHLLNYSTQFATLHGILNDKDIAAAKKAGEAIESLAHKESNEAFKIPEAEMSTDEFEKRLSRLEQRILSKLVKSD